MGQAFVVVLREGFEAFLIVAITLTYLHRSAQSHLARAVYWGIVVSIATSALLGFMLLHSPNEAIWEGVFGLVAAVLIGWLVVHMWRAAPRLKRDMEAHLSRATVARTTPAAFVGVFLFTVLMVTREGMETALLLIQIREPEIIMGIVLGLVAAIAMAVAWVRVGHLINLKLFFQVTSVFLLLFVVQILIYSFHELTEAGIFPQSEVLHHFMEPFSPEGVFGKWFPFLMIFVCAVWLLWAWIANGLSTPRHAEKVAGVS